MHEIMGRPMIDYVVGVAQELNPNGIIVVVGHGREILEEHLKDTPVVCAVQKEQKGTAHALLSTAPFLSGKDVLVLYGDVPLMELETVQRFLSFYESRKSIVFMTTDMTDPKGYGRIIGDGDRILEIREEIEATPEEREIREINTGICVIPGESFAYLHEINAGNKKGEYYLTDICRIARSKGKIVRKYNHANAAEVLGVNSRKELMEANVTMKIRVIEKHMKKGVSFPDTNVYIDDRVEIGKDTTIFPNCYLMGNTIIGSGVSIGPNTVIRDSKIHDDVIIEGFVFIEDTEVNENSQIDPFSRLCPKTPLRKAVKSKNIENYRRKEKCAE